MRALIVSDQTPTSIKIREMLLREGHDCPPTHVIGLDQCVPQLVKLQPELVIFTLSPRVERALNALNEVRNAVPAAHLWVVGPTAEAKVILRAQREGASRFLDETDLVADLRSALGGVGGGAQGPATTGRLIAILAPSGGSGSSTLAANVATHLAKEHERCVLFDLKLETGDLAALMDLKPTYTLADLCQNVTRLDRVMFERSLVRHSSGVHLLAPPRTLSDLAYVKPEGVRQALALGRATFPYVVADVDHTYRDEQTVVLRQADIMLLVLRLDFASLRNTRRSLEHLEHLGVTRDRIRLVVNRYGQPKEVPAQKAEEALGLKIFHYIPDDARTVNRANNNGVPVILEAPSAKISRSVIQLSTNINGRHQG